ncbi:PilW family protein [Amphritea sp. HPY]|uniref:PilW family protein n=1 Tax=Amphritea sp. HPY TaxID=3421652 RepID=UPI003D7DB207
MNIALHRRQSGFSLVEMMISTAVGLLLISGVLSAYVASSKSYRLQEAMSQVQETGRYILERVPYDLRNAGLGLSADVAAIQGYANAAAAETELSDGPLLTDDDRIAGEVVYIPAHDGAEEIAYYVATDTDGVLSLYRYEAEEDKEIKPLALVQGVEEIAVEYGLDSSEIADHQVDEFKAVADVTDWTQVVAVRLSFLVASLERGVLDERQTLAAPFTGSNQDRRLYRTYTTTIGLRNRLL